jgi:hypothetical protein
VAEQIKSTANLPLEARAFGGFFSGGTAQNEVSDTNYKKFSFGFLGFFRRTA